MRRAALPARSPPITGILGVVGRVVKHRRSSPHTAQSEICGEASRQLSFTAPVMGTACPACSGGTQRAGPVARAQGRACLVKRGGTSRFSASLFSRQLLHTRRAARGSSVLCREAVGMLKAHATCFTASRPRGTARKPRVNVCWRVLQSRHSHRPWIGVSQPRMHLQSSQMLTEEPAGSMGRAQKVSVGMPETGQVWGRSQARTGLHPSTHGRAAGQNKHRHRGLGNAGTKRAGKQFHSNRQTG